MASQQKCRAIEMLCRDMCQVYGERIFLNQLSEILWFNSDSSLRWAIREGLALTINRESDRRKKYVLTEELVKLLMNHSLSEVLINEVN